MSVQVLLLEELLRVTLKDTGMVRSGNILGDFRIFQLMEPHLLQLLRQLKLKMII